MTTLPIADAYRLPIRTALTIQIMLAPLFLLLLDGGDAARISATAMAGFWIGATLILLRRPLVPAPMDLDFVKWGYVLVLIVAFMMMPLTGVLRR